MKPALNIYDASQTRDVSKLAPAKGGALSADIDREKAAAFLRDTIKLHDEWAADRTAQAFGTPYKAWLAAKYPCEMTAARATPSPAPIQQPFAWIIVRDSTGEHDGGEPMTDKAEADDYMANRCLPGWHLEALYRLAPTVKASQ